MTSTSYAQLFESNQQLQMKIAQLQSQQLSFNLFQKQIKQEMDLLRNTRGQLDIRVQTLSQQLQKQKECYQDQLQAKDVEITRLKIESDILKSQRQRDLQMIDKLQQKLKLMQQGLRRKTQILNKCFKAQLQSSQNQ